MSIIKVNAVQTTSGVEKYLSSAWINFNGTGTVAIRNSGNVTSITDNGVGDYTINYTTTMPDENYSLAGFATNNDNNNNESYVVSGQNTGTFSSSSSRIHTSENTGSSTIRSDTGFICLNVFR